MSSLLTTTMNESQYSPTERNLGIKPPAPHDNLS